MGERELGRVGFMSQARKRYHAVALFDLLERHLLSGFCAAFSSMALARVAASPAIAVVMAEVVGRVRCKSAADITFGHRAQKVSRDLFVLQAHTIPYFLADPETS